MAKIRYSEEENLIAPDEISQHVMLSLLRDMEAGLPGLENWLRAAVKTPVVIHDINGKPLFHDYPFDSGGEAIGHARAAVSKVLGAPVVSYELGPRTWDADSALRKLSSQVRKKNPSWEIVQSKLVCYSYPKLGIMLDCTDGKGQPKRLIFDVASLDPIPEKPPAGHLEGSYAWSFYEALDDEERRRRMGRYRQFETALHEISSRRRLQIVKARKLADLKVSDFGAYTKYSLYSIKKLQFCPHYRETEDRSHHCFVLHGQQVNDYCAVATCQMILCYYRYYYTQAQIAPDLGYGPGGCPSDQSAGYEALSNNALDATFDGTPNWKKAKIQIDSLRPLKSGIPGHARACAGYSYCNLLFGGIQPVHRLYIYDPWPWDPDLKLGGAVTWEDWDSVTHTNYIYTQIVLP